MRCPRCRHDSPPRAKFCAECGHRLAPACATCGTELPDTAKFCPECGQPVAGPGGATGAAGGTGAAGTGGSASAAAPSRAADAAVDQSPVSYTPRHLAERILVSRAAVEGERKPVTVLFCDLVGSTALAERLGPEGMHVLVNRFFEAALAEIHRYEGTVNQFLGDGFMALFGAPLAHEDHARRATLAALGVARALREQPITVGAEEIRVAVRMGLHTGFVVVGAIGDNLRMDYTAVGDTTHLAARLQQLAEPGTILASEATHRLIEGYVEAERLGPVAVRGRSEPVVVYRVLAPGRRRAALDAAEPHALSPFVGRERELRTLLGLVEAVEEGRGQAVGIVGEPGVGKSRLLLELRRALGEARVLHRQGRCLSFGATIPFVPVTDLIRAHCGIADPDPPERVAEKVRLALRDVGLEPEAACLLHLLGVKDPQDARPELTWLSPEAVQGRTFDALRQLFLRASRRRPLVLEIEDLHWIDRASEDFLAWLAEALGGAAILLVGTYRPGYRPPWADRSFATQLSLGRLPREESLRLLRSVLPGAGPADPVARLILDKGEGNPFFLEELARAAEDQGLGAGLPVPDTVHGVLTARIDRLPEEAKRLLQTAAVLGREFSARLLAAVWDGGTAEPHLRELTRLEFLVARSAADEPLYAFKHALTQDVAEATLLPSRRRELHRRAAAALERLYPDRVAELAPVLAHHYGEAEAWAPAAANATRAAEAARAVFANREALARYEQAIRAAARAALGPAELARLHEGQAAVHAVLGEFEPARAAYEAALARLREQGDVLGEAQVLGALGALWGGHRDYERALALGREAVAAVERAGDTPVARRGRAAARLQVGLLELNLARCTAGRRELEAALALFREAGDAAGEGRALDALAMCVLIAGDLDLAIAHARAAMPRLAEAGDRHTEVSCTANLGFALLYRGRRAEGERAITQALEMARAIGARSHEAYVQMVLAELVEPYGEWGRAHQSAGAGLAIARELGHREWTAAALGVLGRVRRGCGDVAGARALHEEMLGIARELRATMWTAAALGQLGEDLAAAGERRAGARHLAEAIEVAGEAAEFGMRPRLALAQLALAEGRAAEALAHARRVQADVAQYVLFAAEARRIEGEALGALGEAAAAERLIREAQAEIGRLAAAPAGWRAALALARVLDARGDPAGAAQARARARACLDEVAGSLAGAPALQRGFEASPAFREAQGAPRA